MFGHNFHRSHTSFAYLQVVGLLKTRSPESVMTPVVECHLAGTASELRGARYLPSLLIYGRLADKSNGEGNLVFKFSLSSPARNLLFALLNFSLDY